MQIIISRMREDGTWPTVGTSDRVTRNVATERGAMRVAAEFARGRSYRIEFFHEGHFYNQEPFKVIEQAALPFPRPYAVGKVSGGPVLRFSSLEDAENQITEFAKTDSEGVAAGDYYIDYPCREEE
jgi:hypothetical protein